MNNEKLPNVAQFTQEGWARHIAKLHNTYKRDLKDADEESLIRALNISLELIDQLRASSPQPNEVEVVDLIKAAIWANSTPDDCSIEAVERAMGEAAQAALRALTDAGYQITKRG